MNILHVMSRLPVGGVENQLLTVLRKYDRERVQPYVCCLSDKGEVGREIEQLGIEVFCLNKLRHRFDWTIVKDIYSLIKHKDVEIVRTHQYHANLYGRLAAIFARVSCTVASVHNIYTMDKKFHRRIINKLLTGFTDKVIAVSEAVKSDIVRYDSVPEEKVDVIYNGIDTGSFLRADGSKIRSEFGIPATVPVIGTVGRLSPQKGQKYLLEAIARAVKKHPHIVLLIVGNGPINDELREYASTLGIKEHAIFTGARKDIPVLLAAMDVFVFPSLWEGLGNALIEAMAAGKPIIASDLPPVREVINSHEVGILVPAADYREIASALERLLSDKELSNAMGEAARKRAATCFDIDYTMKRYMDLFTDILERKGRY